MHDHAVVIGVSSLSMLAVAFRHKAATLSYESAIAGLYPHQLKGLDDLVGLDDDPDPPIDAATLYTQSHGLTGLWKRWRNRRSLMALAQLRYCLSDITDNEKAYIATRVNGLARASISAAWWGILRHFAPHRAAQSARRSLRMYKELAYMVRNIYTGKPDNSIGLMLASVL